MKSILAAASAACVLACGVPKDPRVEEASAAIQSLEARVAKLERHQVRPPPSRAQKAVDPNATYYVPVRSSDGSLGADEPKVTLVEAYEFACPYCAMLHPTVMKVLDAHSDQLRVVPKQFVVHPDVATEPALAACAAQRQGRFGEFTSALWKAAWGEEERPRLDRNRLSRDSLLSLAKGVGLDVSRFAKDIESSSCREELSRGQSELGRAGVRGTPTLFLNGKRYNGQRTVEALSAAVEREIALADQAVAKGADLSSYYDRLIAKGVGAP